MALTPQQALSDKREREKEAVDALEKQIDAELLKRFNGRESVSIDRPQVSEFVLDEVLKRFRQNGWDVVERNAGYNETNLEFKPRPTASEVEDYYNR